MPSRTRLTTVETVSENGSWLFSVRDQYGELDEVILVPCENGDGRGDDAAEPDVEAWVNRCTHEAQRLDRGFGAAMRDGQVICPKHGSMFDACSGYCDNGEAADTTLVSVEVAVEDGAVYLTDEDYEFSHEGNVENGGDIKDGGDESAEESDEVERDEGDNEAEREEGDGEDERDEEDDDDDMPSSTSHIGF